MEGSQSHILWVGPCTRGKDVSRLQSLHGTGVGRASWVPLMPGWLRICQTARLFLSEAQPPHPTKGLPNWSLPVKSPFPSALLPYTLHYFHSPPKKKCLLHGLEVIFLTALLRYDSHAHLKCTIRWLFIHSQLCHHHHDHF